MASQNVLVARLPEDEDTLNQALARQDYDLLSLQIVPHKTFPHAVAVYHRAPAPDPDWESLCQQVYCFWLPDEQDRLDRFIEGVDGNGFREGSVQILVSDREIDSDEKGRPIFAPTPLAVVKAICRRRRGKENFDG